MFADVSCYLFLVTELLVLLVVVVFLVSPAIFPERIRRRLYVGGD